MSFEENGNDEGINADQENLVERQANPGTTMPKNAQVVIHPFGAAFAELLQQESGLASNGGFPDSQDNSHQSEVFFFVSHNKPLIKFLMIMS